MLKQNLLFSFLTNGINVIAPLILMPYVTQNLGSYAYGGYVYYESISQYLAFALTLSTLVYGSREIGYVKSNLNERSKIFRDIIFLRLTLFIAILTTLLFLYIIKIKFSIEFYVFLIFLLSSVVDCTFFLQGIGDFKKLAIRTILLKSLNIILVLILIKNPEDLIKFILITTGTSLIANSWLFYESLKKIDIKEFYFNYKSILNRFSGIMKLVLVQASILVSLYIGKSLLGILTTLDQVAYFDIAFKFILLTQLITSSISAVVMPEISNLVYSRKKEKMKALATDSLAMSLYIMIPIFFLIQLCASEVINIFFTEEFIASIILLKILAVMILIIPFGNVIGVQLLIPMKKEFTISLAPFLGLITNSMFCILLIPKYGVIIAALGAVIGEFIGSMFVTLKYSKMLDMYKVWKNNFKIILISILVFYITKKIETYFILNNQISTLALKGIIFTSITIIFLKMTKDEYLKYFIKTIRK